MSGQPQSNAQDQASGKRRRTVQESSGSGQYGVFQAQIPSGSMALEQNQSNAPVPVMRVKPSRRAEDDPRSPSYNYGAHPVTPSRVPWKKKPLRRLTPQRKVCAAQC